MYIEMSVKACRSHFTSRATTVEPLLVMLATCYRFCIIVCVQRETGVACSSLIQGLRKGASLCFKDAQVTWLVSLIIKYTIH